MMRNSFCSVFAAYVLLAPEDGSGVALAAAVPSVPFDPPTAPEIPAPTEEDDRERKAKNPRLTPPEGGWKEFPPADGSFDPEKYSAPAKKDFSPAGPFYENYRMKKIEEEIEVLERAKLEIKDDIRVWEQCGFDPEKVAARQGELRTKNKLMSVVREGGLPEADLKELLEMMKAQGLV